MIRSLIADMTDEKKEGNLIMIEIAVLEEVQRMTMILQEDNTIQVEKSLTTNCKEGILVIWKWMTERMN